MLATTLQQMIDRKLTSAAEISELTGVATSTVYRWLHGTSEPDFNAIRLLLRHLPDVNAQRALLDVFTAGTTWRFFNAETDLDLNQDGRIDHEDAMSASIESVRVAGESLWQLRHHCEALPNLGKSEGTQLVAVVGEVIHHCTIVQRIVTDMVERRKKARET